MWSILSIIVLITVVVVVVVVVWIHRWRNPKISNGVVLPPGSSGFPLIGESLELLSPIYSIDIIPFVKNRMQRYGSVFRSNVAGHNVIVSTDADFNRFIFQQENKLVVRCYFDVYEKVFNQAKMEEYSIHKFMRGVTLSHFGLESIKQKLLSEFEEHARATIHSWSLQDSVEVKAAALEMFGVFGAKQLFSDDIENAKELSQRFLNVTKSSMSFPVNIPGTLYHQCIKEKKKAEDMIKKAVKTRLASLQSNSSSNNSSKDDLLTKIINEMSKSNSLSEELICMMLIGSSYATFETIPSMLPFALKFISENPAVLQELIAEHDEILKKRENMDSLITWEEYKSMPFTLQVINETLRLANIMPGFLRKAVKDIQVNGYTIPAGWRIMSCMSTLHLDPKIYKDPFKFDPWRWKGVTSEFMSQNFKPFGGGIKQCAGADYSRATLSIILHLLITKYRWKIVKGGDIIQNPILQFKNGLHISLHPKGEIKTQNI